MARRRAWPHARALHLDEGARLESGIISPFAPAGGPRRRLQFPAVCSSGTPVHLRFCKTHCRLNLPARGIKGNPIPPLAKRNALGEERRGESGPRGYGTTGRRTTDYGTTDYGPQAAGGSSGTTGPRDNKTADYRPGPVGEDVAQGGIARAVGLAPVSYPVHLAQVFDLDDGVAHWGGGAVGRCFGASVLRCSVIPPPSVLCPRPAVPQSRGPWSVAGEGLACLDGVIRRASPNCPRLSGGAWSGHP